MRRIVGLFYYPVKSMAAVRANEISLAARGMIFDREWMVVDTENRFITQREVPKLTIHHDAAGSNVFIPRRMWGKGELLEARVWGDTCEATDQGREVANFISRFCDRHLRLVRMRDHHLRPSKRLPPGEQAHVGFADGYPLLFTSEESLTELNRLITEQHGLADFVPMDRFRPNVVVSGCVEPFEEDHWNEFTVNGLIFQGAKPSRRCTITTVDQSTGARGKEPLRTLSTFRKEGHEVYFGMNVNHLGHGQLKLGDEITVTRFGPRPPT
jgi:uncharacterized protein YcbX